MPIECYKIIENLPPHPHPKRRKLLHMNKKKTDLLIWGGKDAQGWTNYGAMQVLEDKT